MQLKTILNRVQKHHSFIYGRTRWGEIDGRPSLDIEIRHRANGRPKCSGCQRPRPGYDSLPTRRFEFVPVWGIIMAHMSKAIDKVRAQEVKTLKAKGYEPVLKKPRWLLLKRPENLTEKQGSRLAELLQYNLRAVRAYLLKEEFQFFWRYVCTYWAGTFLDRWCARTMRSRIVPMKKVARMLRQHRPC